jgi:hypothetical protein
VCRPYLCIPQILLHLPPQLPMDCPCRHYEWSLQLFPLRLGMKPPTKYIGTNETVIQECKLSSLFRFFYALLQGHCPAVAKLYEEAIAKSDGLPALTSTILLSSTSLPPMAPPFVAILCPHLKATSRATLVVPFTLTNTGRAVPSLSIGTFDDDRLLGSLGKSQA